MTFIKRLEVEERRKELEENENTGDEKINLLEEEVKEVSRKTFYCFKGRYSGRIRRGINKNSQKSRKK